MFREMELWKEPMNIFDKIPEYKEYCEMSEFEQAFLCAMLRVKKPKKVLEIGVAAGGTTAVMLNALDMICKENNTKSKMYSVDLCTEYYRNPEYNTGFVAEAAKQYLNGNVNHIVKTGFVTPKFIDEIGRDIDFVVIDTSHALPGELLDFIIVLPYLTDGAVVVLHDISYNVSVVEYGYATKLLFDTVNADKYIMRDQDKLAGFPNIAAFVVNENTRKYIANCFSALTITWRGLPGVSDIELYRKIIKANYDKEKVEIFDIAVKLQKYMACKRFKDETNQSLDDILDMAKNNNYFIIYGCGKWGREIAELAKDMDIQNVCYAISDDREITSGMREEVYHISDVPYPCEECVVCITTESKVYECIKKKLEKRGYRHIY